MPDRTGTQEQPQTVIVDGEVATVEQVEAGKVVQAEIQAQREAEQAPPPPPAPSEPTFEERKARAEAQVALSPAPGVSPPSEETVQAFAIEQGLSVDLARETIARYQRAPQSEEFKALLPEQLQSLQVASAHGAPSAVAPRALAEGDIRVREVKTTAGDAVLLADDTAIAISEWNKLPERYQSIGLRRGYDVMIKTMRDDQLEGETTWARETAIVETQDIGAIQARQVSPADLKEFIRTHVIIGGNALPIDEWNKLDPKYQSIALRDGFDAVVKAQEADIAYRLGIVQELKKAGFEQPPSMRREYPEGGAPFEAYETASPVYDLVGALQAGFDRSKLVDVFGEDVVKDTERTIQDLQLTASFPSLALAQSMGNPDVKQAATRLIKIGAEAGLPRDFTLPVVPVVSEIRDGKKWQNIRTGETYTDVERRDAIAQSPTAQDEIVRIGKGVDIEKVEKTLETMPSQWEQGIRGFADKYSTGVWSRGLITGGGGFLVALASIPVFMAGLAIKAGRKPKEIPKLAKTTAIGMAEHIYNTASGIVSGKYEASILRGDALDIVRDTVISTLILEGVGKGVKGVSTKLTTYVAPRGIPSGAIVKEISTGRVKTPEEFALKYADALNKAEQLAMTKGGKFTGEVPIEGTSLAVRYLKTPMEQVLGDVLFHGTADIIGKTGEIVKESALRIAEREGKITTGKGGLYTSPYAAIGFTRGGQNPGLLMIITDATKLKSGAKGLAKGLTPSDAFIRDADKGFYGSSKTWRGDLETEVVGARGTVIETPPPRAGLLTRILAGKSADFFTTDGGKYVPIKLGIDVKNVNPLVVEALKDPATLRAIKLWTLVNALRDTTEALKHPDVILKDVAGTIKELVNFKRYFERGSGGGGMGQFPGVRNAYLIHKWGTSISEIARNLFNEAFRRTKKQLGERVREDSAEFRRANERNMDDVYRANADTLIRAYSDIAKAYSASEIARSKFEASYIANLSLATESVVKSSAVSASTIGSVISDLRSLYPESAMRLESMVSRPATRVPETVRTATTTETPVTTPVTTVSEIRTPITETPESLVTETPVTSPVTSPVSSPVTSPVTTPVTTYTPVTPITPRTPYTPITKKPPITLIRLQTQSPMSQPVPEGSIAFALGKHKGIRGLLVPQWYYVPPPYDMDKPISLSAPPMGAVRTDSVNPYETIQMIGRSRTARVPQSVSIDIGITDAFITDYGRTITFKSKGTQTDVGTRIPSTTVGMDTPASEDVNPFPDSTLMEQPKLQSFSRVRASKKQPNRKGKRDDYTPPAMLRGIRY